MYALLCIQAQTDSERKILDAKTKSDFDKAHEIAPLGQDRCRD